MAATPKSRARVEREPSTPDAESQRLRAASLRAADAVSRLVEFWGFSRHLGRAYVLLYLSEEPLSTGELAELMGSSSSACSSVLTELMGWHAVRKVWRAGERRTYWEADASPWRVVRGVLGRREGPLLVEALANLGEAEALLRGMRRGRRHARFMRRRLAGLRLVTKTAQGVVSALAEGRPAAPATTTELDRPSSAVER
ncbi:MAG: hypothetical protein GXP55_15870 [Deltaproteobacteria bacterium]|nr:hypothetical protein [Deltaproteobacteria bacterium]